MDAKLTLSIRPDAIEKAKAWARKQGTSLSALVEQYLEKSATLAEAKETPLEAIRRLSKGLPQLTDEEYAKRKHNHLTKKYGSR